MSDKWLVVNLKVDTQKTCVQKKVKYVKCDHK